MSKPTTEEMRFVVGEVAARLLVQASENETHMRRLVRDWFPQHVEQDELTLRELVIELTRGLTGMAHLIDQRRERQVVAGTAKGDGGGRPTGHARAG